jgi:hypothetical protein
MRENTNFISLECIYCPYLQPVGLQIIEPLFLNVIICNIYILCVSKKYPATEVPHCTYFTTPYCPCLWMNKNTRVK